MSNEFTLSVASEEAAIGQCGEMADMSNPRGYIYGIIYFVVATFADGSVFNHFKSYKSEEDAEALCGKIEAAMKWRQREVDPKASSHWSYFRTTYGSQRFSREEAGVVAREKADDLARM